MTPRRSVLISVNSDSAYPLTISNFFFLFCFVLKSLDDRSCWSRCALACIKDSCAMEGFFFVVLFCFLNLKS